MDRNLNHDQVFQNSRYNNERVSKQVLILDVDDSDAALTNNGIGFSVKLFEPLIIDKHSEIFLDNFFTFNSNVCADISTSAFCLKINEFTIQSNVASTSSVDGNLFNSIIIPNENGSVGNYFSTVIHKAKKMNYVCDINPTRLSKLSGTITDLNGDGIFHGNTDTDNDYNKTYFISGLAPSNVWTTLDSNAGFIPKGKTFELETTHSGGETVKDCKTLTNTNRNSDTIYFTTKNPLTISDYQSTLATSPTVTLDFDSDPTLKISTTTSGLHFENGRFIAEFSIISRE